jgi:hypothetical protein
MKEKKKKLPCVTHTSLVDNSKNQTHMQTDKILFRRKLKSSLIAALAVSFLVACGQNGNGDSTKEGKRKESQSRSSLDQQKVPQELLTLARHSQEQEMVAEGEGSLLQDGLPKENLYGKFFNERAEFYIIEKPQNSLYRSKVNKLTLYYLDGQLSQTRYILAEDIVDDLLQIYGSFSITGHDAKNQALIRSRQIFTDTPNGRVLNKALDNYQISWQLEQQQIRYRVNKHERASRFNYLERVKAYKKTFSEIERAGA